MDLCSSPPSYHFIESLQLAYVFTTVGHLQSQVIALSVLENCFDSNWMENKIQVMALQFVLSAKL